MILVGPGMICELMILVYPIYINYDLSLTNTNHIVGARLDVSEVLIVNKSSHLIASELPGIRKLIINLILGEDISCGALLLMLTRSA